MLLVVGARDEEVLRLNRAALRHLPGGRLAVVPGATHLFEEPGALDAAARLATGWFARWLATAAAPEARAPA
ncbi:putative phosphoribosyl transferase Rv0571c [Anaeromyxobacter sp. PSR-1]|nr:putative phosphoribosyl transferase Rv0571c [Anaeromyxobacter sp. PSR-1]